MIMNALNGVCASELGFKDIRITVKIRDNNKIKKTIGSALVFLVRK